MLFLLFLFVKAGQIAVGKDIVLYAGIGLDDSLIQAERFLTLTVHADNLKSTLRSDGLYIGGKHLIGRVGYLAVKDIGLEEIVGAVLGLKRDVS